MEKSSKLHALTTLLFGKMPLYTHCIGGWAYPTASVNTSDQRTPLVLVANQTMLPQLTSPQPSHCINYATTAPRQVSPINPTWWARSEYQTLTLRYYKQVYKCFRETIWHHSVLYFISLLDHTSFNDIWGALTLWIRQAICNWYISIFSNATTSWHRNEILLICVYAFHTQYLTFWQENVYFTVYLMMTSTAQHI